MWGQKKPAPIRETEDHCAVIVKPKEKPSSVLEIEDVDIAGELHLIKKRRTIIKKGRDP